LNGEKILKIDAPFRKAISVQESLALMLRFLASGVSYISLQYLFKISNQQLAVLFQKCVKLLLKNLKMTYNVRQIFLFVVYERSFKLDFNQNFHLNTTETRRSYCYD